jgi:hypothetical protein
MMPPIRLGCYQNREEILRTIHAGGQTHPTQAYLGLNPEGPDLSNGVFTTPQIALKEKGRQPGRFQKLQKC